MLKSAALTCGGLPRPVSFAIPSYERHMLVRT
jgi:hypothetical protein